MDSDTIVKIVAAAVSAALMAQGYGLSTDAGRIRQDAYEMRRGEKAWRARMEERLAECVRQGETDGSVEEDSGVLEPDE